MKVYFFTAQPQHPTYSEIIEVFKINSIEFELINPTILEAEQLRNILLQADSDAKSHQIVFLIIPDHPIAYDVCRFAIDHHIECINNAESTLKFLNRWQIENELKIYMDELKEHPLENPNQLLVSVETPKSWFIVTETNLTEDEKTEFIKNLEDHFELEFPLIVKYPISHTGFHFTRIIETIKELKALMPFFETSGLIIQKNIENTGITLKYYKIGPEIVVLTEDNYIPDFRYIPDFIGIQKPEGNNEIKPASEIAKKLLELNSAEFRDYKLLRKKGDAPQFLNIIINKIGQRFGLDIFGVDLIIDKYGNYLIVDVNDFPGLRGIEKVGEKVLTIVKSKIKE